MKKQVGKVLVVCLILVLVAVLLYKVRGPDRREQSEGAGVVVKRGDVIARATETGSVVPMSAVEIKSEQAGEVKKIFVQAGDRVVIGQPLATLRLESDQARRVAEARAKVTEEQLNWDEAQREYQRSNELFAKGFIARKELEAALKQEEKSKIQYELAKKQLLLTLGGNRTLYEKYLVTDFTTETVNDFSVLSPVSGTVIEVNTSEGEIVSSGMSNVTGGTPLMRISDLSKMWVKTKINEVNIGQIHEGQPAEIRLDAVQNHVYQGTVAKISPKGEKVDNVVSYEVTIGVTNPDARLMPFMTANVDIITRIEKDVLYLPQMALTRFEGHDAVRLPSIKGQDRFQPIEVGLKNETVAVITKGLAEGDRVLLPKAETSQKSR